MIKSEQSIQELWGYFKKCSICITGLLEERENGAEGLFEVLMVKAFQN